MVVCYWHFGTVFRSYLEATSSPRTIPLWLLDPWRWHQ